MNAAVPSDQSRVGTVLPATVSELNYHPVKCLLDSGEDSAAGYETIPVDPRRVTSIQSEPPREF